MSDELWPPSLTSPILKPGLPLASSVLSSKQPTVSLKMDFRSAGGKDRKEEVLTEAYHHGRRIRNAPSAIVGLGI